MMWCTVRLVCGDLECMHCRRCPPSLRDTFLLLNDLLEILSFYPSCNTVQGVLQLSEYYGGKPCCVMKVIVDRRSASADRHVQPPLISWDRCELELNCNDPKDGELLLGTLNPTERSVEDERDVDVQIALAT